MKSYLNLIKLLRDYKQVQHEDMMSDPKHLMNLAADALEQMQIEVTMLTNELKHCVTHSPSDVKDDATVRGYKVHSGR